MLPCPLKETLLSQYPQQWMGTIYTTRFFVHEKFWNMHGTLKINLYILQWWKVIPWKFHGWDFYMNMLWNFYVNIFVYETFTFHIWPKMNIVLDFMWNLHEINCTFHTQKTSSDYLPVNSPGYCNFQYAKRCGY